MTNCEVAVRLIPSPLSKSEEQGLLVTFGELAAPSPLVCRQERPMDSGARLWQSSCLIHHYLWQTLPLSTRFLFGSTFPKKKTRGAAKRPYISSIDLSQQSSHHANMKGIKKKEATKDGTTQPKAGDSASKTTRPTGGFFNAGFMKSLMEMYPHLFNN